MSDKYSLPPLLNKLSKAHGSYKPKMMRRKMTMLMIMMMMFMMMIMMMMMK